MQGTDRLPTPRGVEPGYFSVEDIARLMLGFVPERSFTKDRRMIDMHIVPCRCLRHARRVLPADHGFHRVTGGLGNLLVMAQAGSQPRRQSHSDGEGDHAAAQGVQAAGGGERGGLAVALFTVRSD